MNQSDESTRNDGQGVPLSDAQPYRTPTDVADTPASRGMFRSPVAWVFAGGTALVVGWFLISTNIRRETGGFGGSRMSAEEYQRRLMPPVREAPAEEAPAEE